MRSPRTSVRRWPLVPAGALVLATVLLPLGARVQASARRTEAAGRVTERDFHISAPSHLRAGTVVLHVTNRGPDDHELIVVHSPGRALPLRSDGVTVDEDALHRRVAGGLEAAEPGRVRTLRLHLRPGRYDLFCNMAGHYLAGMHTRVEVR